MIMCTSRRWCRTVMVGFSGCGRGRCTCAAARYLRRSAIATRRSSGRRSARSSPPIRWEEVAENGTALVEQVPEALRDALSTRTRKKIDPVVAEWEAANRMPATSAVRQMIALQTRQKKDLAAVMSRDQVENVALCAWP